ncbi:protein of unknown function (plasmid) [Caballeronia sp. S22]
MKAPEPERVAIASGFNYCTPVLPDPPEELPVPPLDEPLEELPLEELLEEPPEELPPECGVGPGVCAKLCNENRKTKSATVPLIAASPYQ